MQNIGRLIHFIQGDNNHYIDKTRDYQRLPANYNYPIAKNRLSYNFHKEGYLQEKVE